MKWYEYIGLPARNDFIFFFYQNINVSMGSIQSLDHTDDASVHV